MAERLRSTSSVLGEIHELRDYVSKIDAWAKRINAREIMNERRNPTTGQRAPNIAAGLPTDPFELKRELRRRAGIVPGQAPRHDV